MDAAQEHLTVADDAEVDGVIEARQASGVQAHRRGDAIDVGAYAVSGNRLGRINNPVDGRSAIDRRGDGATRAHRPETISAKASAGPHHREHVIVYYHTHIKLTRA